MKSDAAATERLSSESMIARTAQPSSAPQKSAAKRGRRPASPPALVIQPSPVQPKRLTMRQIDEAVEAAFAARR
jgi:hypothetical protein